MNASDGRLHFRLRTLENLTVVALVFIPLAFIFSVFSFYWIADIVLIGVLYFVFAFVLEQRVIGFDCPHCSKRIETNTPWVCGFCKKANDDANEFPIVHKCKHCGAEPKAYRCHHRECGKLIFLSKDELEANFARCLNVSVEETKPEPEESDDDRWEKERRTIEHELTITDLSAKLEAAKKRAELEKKRTPRERLEKSFENHQAQFLDAREIAEAKRKEVREKFKGNPKAKKQALEAIEDWLRRET